MAFWFSELPKLFIDLCVGGTYVCAGVFIYIYFFSPERRKAKKTQSYYQIPTWFLTSTNFKEKKKKLKIQRSDRNWDIVEGYISSISYPCHS